MKILILFMLVMTNAYAGDMYLTCEDKDGDRFYSDYIMDGPAEVSFSDENMWGTNYSYEVLATMGETNKYIISKTLKPNTYNRKATTYTVITNSWSDEVRVSENISCALRD